METTYVDARSGSELAGEIASTALTWITEYNLLDQESKRKLASQ